MNMKLGYWRFNYEEREKLILGKSLIDEKVDIGAIDLLRKANK